MKRVLTASLMHESNSFNPILTGANDFNVIRGEKIFQNMKANDPASGVIQTLLDQG